ncbi:TPA: hypothetical protein ACH3X1_000899 [Trebouxia sp. C0004]
MLQGLPELGEEHSEAPKPPVRHSMLTDKMRQMEAGLINKDLGAEAPEKVTAVILKPSKPMQISCFRCNCKSRKSSLRAVMVCLLPDIGPAMHLTEVDHL